MNVSVTSRGNKRGTQKIQVTHEGTKSGLYTIQRKSQNENLTHFNLTGLGDYKPML